MWSNKIPTLGRFGPGFLAFSVLSLSYCILVDIIFLTKTEKLSDSVSSLGPQLPRCRVICQSRIILLSFHTKLKTLRLASTMHPLSDFRFPWSVTRMLPLTQQQAHSAVGQDNLLHGQTLFVFATATDSDHMTLHPSPRTSDTSGAMHFSEKA